MERLATFGILLKPLAAIINRLVWKLSFHYKKGEGGNIAVLRKNWKM